MTPDEPVERWRVEPANAGERLDRHVADRLNVSRAQIQRWIRAERVEVDGRAAKASHPVTAGESIVCRPLPAARDADFLPETGGLEVVYEEPGFAVIDKPAGLAVHRGAGRSAGTLANRLLGRYPETAGVGGPGRPGIVHRLDLDTTGVMIVARTEPVHRALADAFAGRRVGKWYLAVVYGAPDPPAGRIEKPIGRDAKDRKRMTVRAGGRLAVTDYRTLASGAGVALVELRLHTGRTHQIRVHLKAAGHPLVGDPVYGEARWRGLAPAVRRPLREFPRPALHAWRLELAHPESGEPLSFTAPPPADLAALWREVTGSDLPT